MTNQTSGFTHAIDSLVEHLPRLVAVRVLQSRVASFLCSQELIFHDLVTVLVQDEEDEDRVAKRVRSKG